MSQIEKAIAYFEDAIRKSDEIIADCSPALQTELNEQKQHFVVALNALQEKLDSEKQPEPFADDYDGLKIKYRVYKARNNEPVEGCFVLRPDKDPAAVAALRAYADATENEQLASDIFAWAGQPEPLSLEQLKQMDGEPVWCEMQPDYYKCGVIGEKQVSEDKKRLVVGFSYGWEWIEDVIGRTGGKIYVRKPRQKL